MVKKFRSKKDAWHLSWHIAKPSYQKFSTDQKIGGLMFHEYDDIIKLLEGDKQLKAFGDGSDVTACDISCMRLLLIFA
jgi:hypothetical protein